MVATSLPSKPKLADEPCFDEKEFLEGSKTIGRGCCKGNLCWPLVKLLTYLAILVFFSLILSAEILEIRDAFESDFSEVKMTFERPTQVTFPAVTVCNNNPIQKSKFCRKYPEYCSSSSDGNGLTVNRNSYRAVSNMAPSDTIPLGQSWQDFAKNCLLVHSSNKNDVECKHAKNIYWSMSHQNCFTFLSGEDKLTGDYRKAALWMVLDFQPEENIENHTIVGGQLFIHDPDSRIPVGFPISSYTLKPGKMYRYRLQQTNYYHLLSQDESGCKYYEDDSQVSSQEECYTMCLYHKFKMTCGCMPDIIPFFDVKHSTSYCKADNTSENCVQMERRTIENACNDICPINCVEHTYEVKVDEIDLPEYNPDIQDSRRNMANIWIKFDSNEQKTYREVPDNADPDYLTHLACLYSAAILLLLSMVGETIISMRRICKSGSSKNSAVEN